MFGQMALVDPKSACVALRAYEGQLKVIHQASLLKHSGNPSHQAFPLDRRGKLKDKVDIRCAHFTLLQCQNWR